MTYKGDSVGQWLRTLRATDFPYSKLVTICVQGSPKISTAAEYVPMRITSVEAKPTHILVFAHLEQDGQSLGNMKFVWYSSQFVNKIESDGEITEIRIGY